MSNCDKIAKENNEMLKDICKALNISAKSIGGGGVSDPTGKSIGGGGVSDPTG